MPERPSLLKQLANRRNARKSTGPRTVEGKRRAARNGIRHGFYAKDLILDGGQQAESPAEYEELLAALCRSVQPRDDYEATLLRRIAYSDWQTRRALRYENRRIVAQTPPLKLDRRGHASPASLQLPPASLPTRTCSLSCATKPAPTASSTAPCAPSTITAGPRPLTIAPRRSQCAAAWT